MACRSVTHSLLMIALLGPVASDGHHAPTEYDFDKLIEIEGTLVEVRWQNPHVRLKVKTQKPDQVWEIEGGAVSILRRTNVATEKLEVGRRVKVAGHTSRRAPSRMFGTNVLRHDGTELLLSPENKPRWKNAALGGQSPWYDSASLEPGRAGIFRVWSSHLETFFLQWDGELPLNEAARKKRAQWDLVHDTVARDCEPVGLPLIMDQPYPMQFIQKGDLILLQFELNNVIRTIHMRPHDRASLAVHVQGRSTGRWEGSTLVVETDGVTWPYLDHFGAPLSPRAKFKERFTPAADGTRLHYVLVIEDPQFLTKPVTMQREWLARPNETVADYNCDEARVRGKEQ